MSELLHHLRRVEKHVEAYVNAGHPVGPVHARVLDDILWGLVVPEEYERAAAMVVVRRIKRLLGRRALPGGEGEGGLRILDEINASGQLDRPIQIDTALVRID